MEQIVKLTYYSVYDLPSDFISRELRIGSDHTVADWKKYLQGSVFINIEIRQRKNRARGKIEHSRLIRANSENVGTTEVSGKTMCGFLEESRGKLKNVFLSSCGTP